MRSQTLSVDLIEIRAIPKNSHVQWISTPPGSNSILIKLFSLCFLSRKCAKVGVGPDNMGEHLNLNEFNSSNSFIMNFSNPFLVEKNAVMTAKLFMLNVTLAIKIIRHKTI